MRKFNLNALRWKYKNVNGFDFEVIDTESGWQWKSWNHPTISTPPTDQQIIDIEAEYYIWKAGDDVIQNRKKEYPPTDELVVALWEKIIENKPESADALQAERIKVKQKYPK